MENYPPCVALTGEGHATFGWCRCFQRKRYAYMQTGGRYRELVLLGIANRLRRGGGRSIDYQEAICYREGAIIGSDVGYVNLLPPTNCSRICFTVKILQKRPAGAEHQRFGGER